MAELDVSPNHINTMKTILAAFLLSSTILLASPLKPASPPQPSGGQSISLLKNNKLETLPKWLESGLINGHQLILVGRTDVLPFDSTDISISIYNEYNLLIAYVESFVIPKIELPFWSGYPELTKIPIEKILDQSEMKPLPSNITDAAWVSITVSENSSKSIKRRSIDMPK